jgi:two-component system sensor histidine kinase DegS
MGYSKRYNEAGVTGMTKNEIEAVASTGAGMDLQVEFEETQRALREVTLMIEQSQGELSKLSQRNAAITAHLQQAQGQLNKLPPEELRMAYDSALDAQQRLLVMRGQLEKLQNDKNHLEKYKAILERIYSQSTGVAASNISTNKGKMASVEIAMRLLEVDPAQARDELSNLKVSAMGTFQKVRNFIFELRPMMLDDLGLVPTIRKYAEAFREQTNLEIGVTVTGTERRLEPYIEVMIFRAIQELIGNASRHSQATTVKVLLDMGDQLIRVTVDDNGKGLDTEILEQGNSLGLKLIKERAEMLGGTFEIDSAAGKGTRVGFSVPARGAV